MRRRDMLAGAAASLASMRGAGAQGSVPVIGFLSGRSQPETTRLLPEFHRGLAEVGYVAGQNVRLEYRFADGRYERLPAFAGELVQRRVAVIATTGGNVTALAAKAATATIPIVFVAGGDPAASGLVESIARPGGNATGVSLFIAELGAKRLELLRELAPKAGVIAVLANPTNPASTPEARDVQARAAALGVTVHILNLASEADLDPAFAAIAAHGIAGLLLANDPLLVDLRGKLVRMAAERMVPTVYFSRDFAEAGGLLSYGTSIGDAYHKAGGYIGQSSKERSQPSSRFSSRPGSSSS
ncbi:MAG TPA: ABC transporter substrate-binding protein [Sphingomicrobium sp.]|nr:ABC transporter substrate-binding protein [Sphingomicrobium sp.]